MKKPTRRRARLLSLALPMVLALLVGNGATPPAHAAVAGAGEADGGGTLSKFPCGGYPTRCSGNFNGLTSGNSSFSFVLSGTQTLSGNLTWSKLPIGGSLLYTDGEGPYCPWWGNAAPNNLYPNSGYWTFDSRNAPAGVVSGAIYHSGLDQGGNVVNVWGSLSFNWLRAGVAKVEISGTVTIQYVLPSYGLVTYGPINWTGHGAFGFTLTTPTGVAGCLGTPATNVNYVAAGSFNILA